MKTLSAILMVLIMSPVLSAQESKYSQVEIKTSAQCAECKERIEEALAFEKGVKKSNLDIDTKIVSVSYRPEKTDPAKIRKAVSKVGYDADNVEADPKAYKKLPACCKKPDDPESSPHHH